MKNKLELNSSNLINMFGSKSNIFSQIFHHLIHLIQKNKEDYQKWMEISTKIYGQTYLKENINRKVANFYKIDDGVTISLLLFTLQTYYSILLKIFGVELAFRKIKSNSYFKEIIESKENSNLIKHLTLMESNELFKQLKITNFLVDESFSWYLSHVTPTFEKILLKLINLVTKFDFEFVNFKGDLFQSLYQDLIHQKVRQKIGEFYTPNWLAQFLIKEIGMKNHFQQKILDPSCGSGVFLINLISIFKKIGKENKSANSEILNNILNKIHGFDLNPVAVFTSKLNYFINIIDLLSDEIQENLEIPIYQKDSIKYQDKNYDLIIGNPPWVNWEQLPKDYRDSLIIECKNFGLFSLKGFESRLGGGRKDFSIIFLYFCVNNYLKLGGTLGFIITQTIFKTKGAGEGFRGFNLQNENIPLKVKIVHDLVQIRPFYSSNMTSIIILEKGAQTNYPIPYIKWKYKKRKENIRSLKDFYNLTDKKNLLASPIDDKNVKSPWVTLEPELLSLKQFMKPSNYTAFLGMNSGGANGVYWIRILSKKGDLLEIENLPEEGKKQLKRIKKIIEKDLIYPVIKSKHLKKWQVKKTKIYTIISQDLKTRKGYKDLKRRWPKTHEYLSNFKELLTNRPAYKKYFHENDPFYSMFNVSTNLFSPYKVVWKRMGTKLDAAVISTQNDEYWNSRLLIPDNVLTYIPFHDQLEAHFVCAIMNSKLFSILLNSFSVSGAKSFGTPSILKHLNVKKFVNLPIQVELATLSKKIHEQVKENDLQKIMSLENKLDESVFDLYGINNDLKAKINEYLSDNEH